MSKYLVCLLLGCALLMAGDKKSQTQAADRQKCLDKCTQIYNNCKQNAQSKTAIEACERSRGGCTKACNK